MAVAARFSNVGPGPSPAIRSSVRRAGAIASVLAVLAALAGCTDGAAPMRPPAPSPLLGLSPPASAAPAIPILLAAPPVGSTQAFDPSRITLVLDDPRLAAVKEATLRDAYVKAAQELSTVLSTAPPPSLDDARAWRYQLGRLRALAGDPLGAAKAYDEAAATEWPLQDYARFAAAQILAKAGQDDDALARGRAVRPGLAIAADLELVLAEALAGKGAIEDAAALWRKYLGQPRSSAQWAPVALRFARALLAHPSEAHSAEAAQLARRVLFEAGGHGAGDAKEIEALALGTLPFDRRKQLDNPTVAELLVRARGLVTTQGREALKVTDGLIATTGDRPGESSCEAWLIRGEALAKLRRKAESADAYESAIDRCVGLPRRVTALFAGGRVSVQAGRPAEAVRRFALLEKDFPAHSYADDARLRGARAVLDMGDEAGFARMLMAMADDYPAGDMVTDGLFDLALTRIEKRDWAGAVAPLERARRLAPRERSYAAAGRLPYYLGRAHLETGSREKGIAELVTTIKDYPLSFYMAVAHARLRDIDAPAAARAVDEAIAREPDAAFQIGDSPAFREPAFVRAVELLWAAAFLLSRAGATRESHGLFRGGISSPVPGRVELTDWLDHYPVGQWRAAWELAYPRPYLDVVSREAKRFGISEPFAFAIMREESAFDPRVVSSASAVGLMQLIVPTARRMAKPLSLPSDVESLKRPEVNVALGCRYLSVLRGEFQDNPLLAIPGYNAGGGAPRKWVAARPSDDFDVFVERIPYEETRAYTKRVITSLAAYEFLYARGQASEALGAPLAVSPAAKAAAVLASAEAQ